MSVHKSKQNISITSNTAPTTTHTRKRIIQNFLLIWIGPNIDESNEDCQNTLAQLRNVANDVSIFTEPDKCVDFLTEDEDTKTFLIIGDTLSQRIIPLIHDISHLDAIYIYSRGTSKQEKWAEKWTKIKGMGTKIAPICESLQQAVKQCNQDSIAMSFVAVDTIVSSKNLDQLDPLFMYTQIFKEILLKMKHNQQSLKNFITYCRNGNLGSSSNITRLEKEYNANLAIWWYTYPSFIYNLLNSGLRNMEADTIINMGFFIRDLHHQIQELYQKQVGKYPREPFTVYRGQGLSTSDFEKLRKSKGGLISFNNFLSTSKEEEVSLGFAESVLERTDMVRILFQMTIDPSVTSIPFAAIQSVSYFKEEEILFSMHTVFRIGEIIKLDKSNPIYQVKLQLTADDDKQLRTLTKHIREKGKGGTEWQRMGELLIKIGQFNKAEEICKEMLMQTSDEGEKVHYYNQLGHVKSGQGDYQNAISFHKKALEILQKTLPPNYPDLATTYSSIGEIYGKMGRYSKALSFPENALEIRQKALPPNHPDLATSYNNIAMQYQNIGEYLKSLSFHEKALEILQKTHPPNHPDLAASYNNIAAVYEKLGDYLKALPFHQKSLEILKKTLPPNHPHLAASYNNIAMQYQNIGEYLKSLPFHEKALEILQKTRPPNHPDFATSYNNIAEVYGNMEDYPKALSFHKKSLEIQQKTLPSNHPDLATSYNNIAEIYGNMGDYARALSFHEKALEIRQKALCLNHPHLATSYNNIAVIYGNMGHYSKALPFHQKSLEILQKTHPPNHPDLAASYNNIAAVYEKLGDYLKALPFHQKSLEILKKTLPPNHPHLAASYNNIAGLYENMRDYSKALPFRQKSLEILQKTLPPNHPDLATSYNNIAEVFENMGDYLKALLFHEKSLEIQQKTLPSNHPDLAATYNNIAVVYENTGDYLKAISFHEKSLEILQKTLRPNHPHLAISYNNIAAVYLHMKQHSKALLYYERARDI
jgi:tetratricopeptide (TPR) repeat protein